MSERADKQAKRQADLVKGEHSQDEDAPERLSGLGSFHAMQRAIQKPSKETLIPQVVLQLQRVIGNQATQRLLTEHTKKQQSAANTPNANSTHHEATSDHTAQRKPHRDAHLTDTDTCAATTSGESVLQALTPVANDVIQLSRTQEEIDSLIHDAIQAVARNESGGASQAVRSRLRTSAGVSASYASSTQMVPARAVHVLRRGPGERAHAARFGLTQDDLRDADRIMHASQRIWGTLVMEGGNIVDLNERDLELTGFTFEELGRMMYFGFFREILRAQGTRFEQITTEVETYLEQEATRLEARIENLLSELSSPQQAEDASPADEGSEDEATEASLAVQAIAATRDRDLRFVRPVLNFALPSNWARRSARHQRAWLLRQRRRITRSRRMFEKTGKRAAQSLIAHELSDNEYVQEIGLHESDIRAYIHEGRFNRFPEDRQAWNRVALQHAAHRGQDETEEPRSLDDSIAAATEHGGGWTLSQIDFESFLRSYLDEHPDATDEQVVRAAADHNSGSHSADYGNRIWAHFQAIRASGAEETNEETNEEAQE